MICAPGISWRFCATGRFSVVVDFLLLLPVVAANFDLLAAGFATSHAGFDCVVAGFVRDAAPTVIFQLLFASH